MEWSKDYPTLIPCFLDVNEYGGVPTSSPATTDVDTDTPMLRITQQFVHDTIRSQEEQLPQWILSTRLDSDDALHRETVKHIQELFIANPRETAFDFIYTYKCIPAEKVVYRYTLINGHFISLAECSERGIRSVLFCNHLAIDRYVATEHILGWTHQTELIHGGNVVNNYTEVSIHGLLYALIHFHKRDFGYMEMPYSRLKAIWMIGSLIKQQCLRLLKR